jgi:ATP-dependent DNA helicase RecQ
LDAGQVQGIVETLQAREGPVDPEALSGQTELSKSKLTAALHHLEDAGAVERLPTGEVVASHRDLGLAEAGEVAAQAQERCRQLERSRVEMMRGYAETPACRHEYLLNYFGEETDGPCGYCDNCDAGLTTASQNQRPFPLNSRVVHRQWGEGQVLRYEGDTMVVLFDKVGYKTLSADVVTEQGLLKTA